MPDDVDDLKSIMVNVKPSSNCCVNLFFVYQLSFKSFCPLSS